MELKNISLFIIVLPFISGFLNIAQTGVRTIEVEPTLPSTEITLKPLTEAYEAVSVEVYDWDTAQIVQLPPILQKIAECESSGRHTNEDGEVIKGVINSFDTGLFQINELYHGEAAEKMGLDIFTLAGNVKYALHLFETQGTQPWSASEFCWSS